LVASSYRPSVRGDTQNNTSKSQSTDTALSGVLTPVSRLLAAKGNDVYSIGPGNTVHDAVKILREKRIGALLVIDENNKLTGILSERDIVRKMAEMPGKTLPSAVKDLMTKEVITCGPDETIVQVLKLMTEKRIRHIPVVQGDDLLGMITIGDVVHHRMAELEHEALRLKQLIVG
jgi:CBS domain-containing protein